MDMFSGKNTIKSRVMSVIDARIKSAQESYDSQCKGIDENCDRMVKEIESKRTVDKEILADRLVDGIVGKIL